MATALSPFEAMTVDYVGFVVADVRAAAQHYVDGYGLAVYATADEAEFRSVAVGRNDIRLVLTQPLATSHPGAAYVARHGDGVTDIALRVPDATAAFEEAVRRGARAVSAPAAGGYPGSGLVTATVGGFGDVTHSFVQRPATVDDRVLPGLRPSPGGAGWDSGLDTVDHFAVCLAAGDLRQTVELYRQVLDFEVVFTEKIVVGAQAMDSEVVQSRSGAVTLTLIEPDTTRAAGQIDDYLAAHGGAGVQHIALTTGDIVRSVGSIGARGVAFLSTPDTYYQRLPGRLDLARHTVDELRELDVLVDQDHDGQLFQIFSRSVHPRNTFFIEVIERLGARTFGSGNIRALYEAIEMQRQRGEAAA
jgi:4-hydroxymandelate synthase